MHEALLYRVAKEENIPHKQSLRRFLPRSYFFVLDDFTGSSGPMMRPDRGRLPRAVNERRRRLTGPIKAQHGNEFPFGSGQPIRFFRFSWGIRLKIEVHGTVGASKEFAPRTQRVTVQGVRNEEIFIVVMVSDQNALAGGSWPLSKCITYLFDDASYFLSLDYGYAVA